MVAFSLAVKDLWAPLVLPSQNLQIMIVYIISGTKAGSDLFRLQLGFGGSVTGHLLIANERKEGMWTGCWLQ